MENSLSKLSSELGVTPFGLAPKSKVGIKKYFIILDWEFVKVWRKKLMHSMHYALMESSLSKLSSELTLHLLD